MLRTLAAWILIAVALAPARGQESDDTLGTLDLQVLSRETGAPAIGEEIALFAEGEELLWELKKVHRTREQGRLRYKVPAGQAFRLHVRRVRGGSPGWVVPAFLPAESRELVLKVATEPDVEMHVRVLDGDQGLPLKGAKVVLSRIEHPNIHGDGFAIGGGVSEDSEVTEADGRVRVLANSGEHRFLTVEKRGFTPAAIELSPGHAEESTELLVELTRPCSLRGRLLDVDGEPLAGAAIRVEELHPGPLQGSPTDAPFPWPRGDLVPVNASTKTGPDGAFLLKRLPAGRALTVFAYSPAKRKSDRKVVRAEKLMLRSGEERRVTWNLGEGHALRGRLIDTGGAPIPSQNIWLLPELTPRRFALRASAPYAKTDAEGHFEFHGVQPGPWRIGPSPWSFAPQLAAPPLATPVSVLEPSGETALRLEHPKGLRIQGLVRGSDGAPVEGATVTGTTEFGRWEDTSNEAGAFELGPLPSGPVEVAARWKEPEMVVGVRPLCSEPQVIAPGTEGVELVVSETRHLSGRVVVGDSEDSTAGVVWLVGEDGSHESQMLWRGDFDFGAVPAGPQTLVAATRDGRIGLLRWKGQGYEETRVHLDTGAHLEVMPTHRSGRLLVRRGGRVVAHRELHPDGLSILVPPGVLTVTFEFDDQPASEVKVRAKSGDSVPVAVQD